jgi:hypothetical protein
MMYAMLGLIVLVDLMALGLGIYGFGMAKGWWK